jgi:hypothetical protein
MKNKEKFANEIIDIAICGSLAIDKETLKPKKCEGCPCYDCLYGDSREDCNDLIKKWLDEEYKEPLIDWSKVPVDTHIYVRNSENEPWKQRHFAKYKYGKVHAWCDGATSWSSDADITSIWKFAELAESEE